jgi:hypothetical protein
MLYIKENGINHSNKSVLVMIVEIVVQTSANRDSTELYNNNEYERNNKKS